MRGRDIVLELPDSRSRVKLPSFLSWNNFGMIHWSDAKTEPSYEERQIGRHPATGEVFWTKRCKVVDRVGLDLGPSREADASAAPVPYAVDPTIEDFERIDAAGEFSDQNMEAHFRTRFWWRANDPQRSGGGRAVAEARFRQNLDRLLSLTPRETPGRDWLEIEIAREVGDFERARRLLNKLPSSREGLITRCFRRWLAENNAKVGVVAPESQAV